jgi:hypothetical protein
VIHRVPRVPYRRAMLVLAVVLGTACRAANQHPNDSFRRVSTIEPVRWIKGDSIVLRRFDQFASDGAGRAACDSTGLYVSGVLWRGGAALCAALWPGYVDLNHDGTSLLYVERGEQTAVKTIALGTLSTTTIMQRCARSWTEASWSPDDTRIAFTGSCEAGDDNAFLYLVNHDGASVRQIGERLSGKPTGPPAWSPDGRVVLAIPRTESQPLIVVIDTATAGAVAVTEGDAPSWAPDGGWIAYLKRRGQGTLLTSIWLTRPDGKANHELVGAMAAAGEDAPSKYAVLVRPPLVWSADAMHLAFARGHGVWIADVGGNSVRPMIPASP